MDKVFTDLDFYTFLYIKSVHYVINEALKRSYKKENVSLSPYSSHA